MTNKEEFNFEDGKTKLPDGWRWVKLGEISTVVRGSSPRPKGDPKYYGGNVPRLMVEDVTRDGMYVTPKVDFLTEEGAKLSRPMKQGDVIMVVSGAPGLPGILAVDACIHDGFVGFRDVEQSVLLNTFLFYFLKCANAATDSLAVGAIFRNLTTDQIKDIDVPLPPLDEQKRIAAILNEKMEGVEEARRNAIAQLEAAKDLPAAYLRSVFNSPEAQQWEINKLRDIAWVSGGIQKTQNRTPKNFHRPYLTVRNVQRGWLDLSNVERFEIKPDELSRYCLEKGDILIVEGNGSIEHIGRNAIFSGEIEECIHQNHIIRVRLNREKVDPKFLSLYLNSDIGKTQMIKKAETTTGLHTLSVSKVEQLEAAIPELSKQKHITLNLSKQLAQAEQLRKTLEEQLEAINQLPAAFLRQAFNGEL